MKKVPTPSKCPLCKKKTSPVYRPFCSIQCQKTDLYNWLTGHYCIPTEERPTPSDSEETAPE